MTLEDVKKILDAEVIAGGDLLHKSVKMACGSDLMSDVLAFVKSDSHGDISLESPGLQTHGGHRPDHTHACHRAS